MEWLIAVIATLGLATDHAILLVNHTGIKIVRIEIDHRKFEEVNQKVEQILVNVTPHKHDMRVIFKGGGRLDWPAFDFKGIHQITFERTGHSIHARSQ